MSDEISVLKLVCQRLDEAKIPYMLTGSLAANFYATPRMTRDIDIVIEIEKIEVNKFFQIFQNEFYLSKDAIIEAINYQTMFNIVHNESIFKVDFIIRKEADYRHTEFQRRRCVLFNNASVWIVAPEDLIISKLYWAKDSNSELQIKDIRNLFVNLKNLDEEYIHKWVKSLELISIFQKVKNYE